jgi:signal transduction histidine kinase
MLRIQRMVEIVNNQPTAEMLQNNKLFAGLDSDFLREISVRMQMQRFANGDVIFREGNPGDCLYLVCQGAVRISKAMTGSQSETLSYVQPGSFFGEMALIDGQPRSAQATAAADDTSLARLDNAMFEHILQRAPSAFHMNFVRSIVERIRLANSHLITELTRTERLSTVGAMANAIIHDLRNPITIICSCADLLAHNDSPKDVSRYTGMIHRATENMTDMIQELLDFARGVSNVQLASVSTKSIMEDLRAQLARLVPKNIEVIWDTIAEVTVKADEHRLSRVLLNLVKNAIEAMPRGGRLTLGVNTKENTAVFHVADNGCGIPDELQPRIFEAFVTHGKAKGTGLGLSIVKSVIDAHQGQISLQSRDGEGTRFEVSIPTG